METKIQTKADKEKKEIVAYVEGRYSLEEGKDNLKKIEAQIRNVKRMLEDIKRPKETPEYRKWRKMFELHEKVMWFSKNIKSEDVRKQMEKSAQMDLEKLKNDRNNLENAIREIEGENNAKEEGN